MFRSPTTAAQLPRLVHHSRPYSCGWLLVILVWLPLGVSAYELLPEPDQTNTMYVLFGQGSEYPPDWDSLSTILRDTLGRDRLYCRLGFDVIHDLHQEQQSPGQLDSIATRLEGYDLAFGAISGVSDVSYMGVDYPEIRDRIRSNPVLCQWMQDGGTIADMDSTYHSYRHFPTFSRYAWDEAVNFRERIREIHDEVSLAIMTCLSAHDNLVVVNGPKEPIFGFHWAGQSCKLGGYEPAMVEEFRDYLTHRGAYADTGVFAGLGYPGGAQFSDDPSPAEAFPRRQVTFNELFGTDFTTWNLRYWDPELWQGRLAWAFEEYAIPDSTSPYGYRWVYCDSLVYIVAGDTLPAKCKPSPGDSGYVAAGVAPPYPPAGSDSDVLYFSAWTEMDSAGVGFRPKLINWAQESCNDSRSDAGIPGAMVFSHGIGNGCLPTGSPYWVYVVDGYGSGCTLLDSMTVNDDGIISLIASFGNDWGTFQYNPLQTGLLHHLSEPGVLDSVHQRIQAALDTAYVYRAHYLGFLYFETITTDSVYFDVDGDGGHFLRKFMDRRASDDSSHCVFDNPYFNESWVDYQPPPVANPTAHLEVVSDDTVAVLAWSERIWADRHFRWDDWGEFTQFKVYRKRGALSTCIATIDSIADPPTYTDTRWHPGDQYKITAVSGVPVESAGDWVVPDWSCCWRFPYSVEAPPMKTQ